MTVITDHGTEHARDLTFKALFVKPSQIPPSEFYLGPGTLEELFQQAKTRGTDMPSIQDQVSYLHAAVIAQDLNYVSAVQQALKAPNERPFIAGSSFFEHTGNFSTGGLILHNVGLYQGPISVRDAKRTSRTETNIPVIEGVTENKDGTKRWTSEPGIISVLTARLRNVSIPSTEHRLGVAVLGLEGLAKFAEVSRVVFDATPTLQIGKEYPSSYCEKVCLEIGLRREENNSASLVLYGRRDLFNVGLNAGIALLPPASYSR